MALNLDSAPPANAPGFFRLSKLTRLGLYLPLLGGLGFFGLRQLEAAATYHPAGYQPGPQWTPPPGGEDVWFTTAGGEQVHGWFVRAPQQPAHATVLYCHGNAGNITNVGWIAEHLATRGLDTFVFDYRGYGRSAGRITDEHGIYADAAAAYDYLRRERGVQAERLVLYGLSLGTTAVIDLAAQRECAALIVESGLSSASDMGRHSFPWLPQALHRLARNRFESVRKIAEVRCPVLVAHGTHDSVIPVEQGRKLFAAAREPKRLLIVERGDHNLVGAGGREYLDSMVEFIRGEALSR